MYTKYLLTFLIISGLYLSVSAEHIDDSNINYKRQLLDTIPIGGYMFDTIVTFDPDTYKSTTAIYKTKIEGYRYDTMMIFDPDTYVETIYVEKVAYGSEKELFVPEKGEDAMKKIVECYVLKWGTLSHNYVYNAMNQISISTKEVDDLLKSDMTWEGAEGCEEIGVLEDALLYVQYPDGNLHLITAAQNAANRGKVQKSKLRKKSGTLYKLDGVYMNDGETSFALPPILLTVYK